MNENQNIKDGLGLSPLKTEAPVSNSGLVTEQRADNTKCHGLCIERFSEKKIKTDK